MTASEVIDMAIDGVDGVVTVDEPIVILGARKTLIGPGAIDLEYLRQAIGNDDARAWRADDATATPYRMTGVRA